VYFTNWNNIKYAVRIVQGKWFAFDLYSSCSKKQSK